MPRFSFSDINRPKRAAKALRTKLSGFGLKVSLGKARDLVAWMSGYTDWQELCHITGTVPPSQLDDAVDESGVRDRVHQQVQALAATGLPETDRSAIAASLALTASFAPRVGADVNGFCFLLISDIAFRGMMFGDGPRLISRHGSFLLGGPHYLATVDDSWGVFAHGRAECLMTLPGFDRASAADFAAVTGVPIRRPGTPDDFYGSLVWRDLRDAILGRAAFAPMHSVYLPDYVQRARAPLLSDRLHGERPLPTRGSYYWPLDGFEYYSPPDHEANLKTARSLGFTLKDSEGTDAVPDYKPK